MMFYLMFAFPGLILGIWAQSKIKRSYKKYSQVPSARGVTGAQAARVVLDANGMESVTIERTAGNLTDHYDPRSKVLRLSEGVYNSRSIAALGIAAHEAGHAAQDAQSYMPFNLRSKLVPMANLGSQLLWPMLIVGLFLHIPIVAQIGVWLFMFAVMFHLVTLPVELNASSRALAMLSDNGLLVQEEMTGAKKVLTAAAMTYVAALAVAILNLVYAFFLTRD